MGKIKSKIGSVICSLFVTMSILLFVLPSHAAYTYYGDGLVQWSADAMQSDGKETKRIPPNETYIHAIIHVLYSEMDEKYYYQISYSLKLVFRDTSNSTAYIPLAEATIEGLVVNFNGLAVQRPEIVNNNIHIHLNDSLPENVIEVKYDSWGRSDYCHRVLHGYLVEKFVMDAEVYDAIDNVSFTEDSLRPIDFSKSMNRTYYHWEKNNAVLNEDVVLIVPTKFNSYYYPAPQEKSKSESYNTVLIVIITVVVIILIVAIAVTVFVKIIKPIIILNEKVNELQKGDKSRVKKQ